MSARTPVVVACGGGRNSGGVLAGLWERGERPDAILFANTGGEKPGTMEFLWRLAAWLDEREWPPLVIVQAQFPRAGYLTLEEQCLSKGMLPDIAYGFLTCSHKWKHEPQEKWLNNWRPARDAWAQGRRVVRIIGIAAEEAHRADRAPTDHPKWEYRHPLLEWGWDTAACVEAMRRVGLPVPPKSACFFCPAMKKREVIDLSKQHPELFERAVAIEHAAAEYNHTKKGLGVHWSWEQLVKADAAQYRLFDDPPQMPCMCDDGDAT